MIKSYKEPSMEELVLQDRSGVILTSYGLEGVPDELIFDDFGDI